MRWVIARKYRSLEAKPMNSDQIDTVLKILLILSQALVIGLTAYFNANQVAMRSQIVSLTAEVAALKAHVVVLTNRNSLGA